MSQLVQLRQKIRSVQTTKKITHAVRLVSMSLYNKLDKSTLTLKTYTKKLKTLFLGLIAHVPNWKNTLLFPGDALDKTPLVIIIATSKGLCGSLNSNLFRYIDSSLFLEKQQEPKFIAIGQRAIAFVKEKGFAHQMLSSYAELNSSNFIALADDLVEKITNKISPYSSVTFYSNEAKSFFAQRPCKVSIVPMLAEPSLSGDGLDEMQKTSDSDDLQELLIWEQDKNSVLDYLAIRYLRSSIIQILFESLRAEHASRFLAMENSTNNAQKYLERLTLQFNKVRQSLITKEVSELTAGQPVVR
mgnify:CR=1 FL=1